MTSRVTRQAFTIQATGQLYNAAAFRPMVVAYRENSPVRLQDIAQVTDSVENDKIAAWYNTEASLQGLLFWPFSVSPEQTPSRWSTASKSRSRASAVSCPAAVELNTLFDRTETIRDSVQDVKFTLLLTIALVILVIFLFLRNLSATIIPSLALPLSIIGTFAAMYGLGFSVNNITLMALTLSVGFVVDDAIVMLENIVRHMEHGETAMDAALLGSKEIGFTIISMTLSLVAVFIPVLFMAGMLGRMLHEFAVTITVAILISGAGFPDTHPHALQQISEAARARNGTGACITSWSVSSTVCAISMSVP